MRTRRVIWPATPSSKPYFPKIRKAAASLPFKNARSLYGSSNFGGPGNLGIFTLASASEMPGSRGAMSEGLVDEPLVSIADGGDILERLERSIRRSE